MKTVQFEVTEQCLELLIKALDYKMDQDTGLSDVPFILMAELKQELEEARQELK